MDTLYQAIKRYLIQLSEARLTEEQRAREFGILQVIDNLKNIGDILYDNLMKLAESARRRVHFSVAGRQEIGLLHQRVRQNLEIAIAAFGSNDARGWPGRSWSRSWTISQLEIPPPGAHTAPTEGYRESIDTSEIHLDILTNLKRIDSHITAIAYPVLELPAARLWCVEP